MKVQTTVFVIVLLVFNFACSLSAPPSEATSDTIRANEPVLTDSIERSLPATEPDIQPVETKNSITNCFITANALHLRACPGIDCAVIDWLGKGTDVTVLKTNGNWLKVQTLDGQTGWVNGKYCGGQP